MSQQPPLPGRRRRQRGGKRDAVDSGPASTSEPAPPDAEQTQRTHRRDSHRAKRDSTDRGMHDLVGGGSSQLGVSGALRGRDVNRPDDDDLAAAERDVVIVRRHWQPPPS